MFVNEFKQKTGTKPVLKTQELMAFSYLRKIK